MKIEKLLKPSSLADALIALNEYAGKAELIAGGTDVLVKLREGHNKYDTLIDISDLPELKLIEETVDALEIGAAVTFTEVVQNKMIQTQLTGFCEACQSVGAPQIRNKGTVGGNIANASPAADSVPPLLALGAELLIGSAVDSRKVLLSEFYEGKGSTVLKPNEMLLKIIIPKKDGKLQNVAFEKLGLRNALAISRLSIAVQLVLDDAGQIAAARVATGSLGLTSMREPKLEAFLVGQKLNETLIEETEALFSEVVVERLSGRSTCEFKKEAVKGIAARVMRKWMDQEGTIC